MPKLALNFICKDESHIVQRMLESAKEITDLIVALDTGSADGTIRLIQEFGERNNIPTYVFERPFDDFSHSRNYALDRLINVVDDLQWDPEDVWGFWADCDEVFVLDKDFSKAAFESDMYNVPGEFDNMPFARGSFFRLSKGFYWYGPVHEAIVCKDPTISVGLLAGVFIQSEKAGRSWKGDIEKKYLRYAEILEHFIDHEDRGARWVFYTGQCYFAAAQYSSDEGAKTKWLKKALQYYMERVASVPEPAADAVVLEERAYAQFQIGDILGLMEYPWPMVEEALLKAYELDRLRGESFMLIIQHYEAARNWTTGYFYSHFAMEKFHGKNPLGKRFIGVEPAFYNWQFLWAHYLMCFYAGKKEEMSAAYVRLKSLTDEHPEYFTESDLLSIQTHPPFVLSINRFIQGWKKRFQYFSKSHRKPAIAG